jgi:hypothetical protein
LQRHGNFDPRRSAIGALPASLKAFQPPKAARTASVMIQAKSPEIVAIMRSLSRKGRSCTITSSVKFLGLGLDSQKRPVKFFADGAGVFSGLDH